MKQKVVKADETAESSPISDREKLLLYQREKARFEMLVEVSKAVSASLNLAQLLKDVSIVLRRYINHDFAGMLLHDKESGMFRLLALDNPPEYLEEGEIIPMEGTPDGLAFKTRKPVWRDCIDLNEFPSPTVKKAFDAGMRSGCAVPLISRDKLIGVLGIGSNRESSITEDVWRTSNKTN